MTNEEAIKILANCVCSKDVRPAITLAINALDSSKNIYHSGYSEGLSDGIKLANDAKRLAIIERMKKEMPELYEEKEDTRS